MSKELPYIPVPKSDIRTSRRFRRGASLGMKVWRSMTINLDLPQIIEHIEIECPYLKLTDRGPVFDRKAKAAKNEE